MRKLAMFRITHELLAQMLHLPPGMRIDATRSSLDLHDAIDIRVECDEFEEREAGSCIPCIQLTYHTVDGVTLFDRWDYGSSVAWHPTGA